MDKIKDYKDELKKWKKKYKDRIGFMVAELRNLLDLFNFLLEEIESLKNEKRGEE